MNRKIIKNALIMATMVLFVPMAAAQVTIGGVQTPDATLHVVAPTTPTGVPIGVIAPQITLANLQGLTGAYIHGAAQHGAIIFVSDAAGTPAGRTELITAVGYYWFDATGAEAAWRWRPFGGGAAEPAPFVTAFNITGNFTVTNQDYIELNIAQTGFTLTLPTENVPLGRRIYVCSGNSAVDMNVIPAPRTGSITAIWAGWSGTFVYVGDPDGTGSGWNIVTGF